MWNCLLHVHKQWKLIIYWSLYALSIVCLWGGSYTIRVHKGIKTRPWETYYIQYGNNKSADQAAHPCTECVIHIFFAWKVFCSRKCHLCLIWSENHDDQFSQRGPHILITNFNWQRSTPTCDRCPAKVTSENEGLKSRLTSRVDGAMAFPKWIAILP